MAFYLAWPYLKKLYNFFISGKYESISQQYPNIKTKWLHLTVRIIKWVFVFDCIISNIISSNNSSKEYGDNAPKVPLYGIYTMTKIIKNNDPLIPLMTDTTLWKRFILEFKGRSAVTYINDTSRWYNASVDTVLKKISFYPNWDTINRHNFHYTIDNNHSYPVVIY